MLDSGAFTMMTSDRCLSVELVASIYRDSQAELCITLDVPPLQTDRRGKRTKKHLETMKNLQLLLDLVGAERVVPVVHGATHDEIERSCRNIASVLDKPLMICLGGLVPLLRRSIQHSPVSARATEWLRSTIDTVRDTFPRSAVHVLGAGSPKNVAAAIACGADSTDSIAWRRAAGFGAIYLPGTSERYLLPRNRQRENSRGKLTSTELHLLQICPCPACQEWPDFQERVRGLSNCYMARAAHNAHVVLAEAKQFTRCPKRTVLGA
jgi:7-cyano-7-deazaguanine tRNA-ribosyltransferase